MSKYQTTMYNRFKRVERGLNSLYRRIIQDQVSFKEYMERREEYFETTKFDRERLTQYYTGKLSGISDTWWNRIQQDEVVWLHSWETKSGQTLYSREWHDVPKKLRYDKKKFKSSHYWKGTCKEWSSTAD